MNSEAKGSPGSSPRGAHRTPVLTLDLGNSSASVAVVGPTGATALARTAAGQLDGPALGACLDRAAACGERPALAAISAVGEPAEERRVRALLEGLGLTVPGEPDPGLDLRIDHPETCGVDRLLAARAAAELVRGRAAAGAPVQGLIVVDAGTAVTVDAVALDGERPAFLGGAIAPGPGTLARSLGEAGARLHEVSLEGGVEALGRSTERALRAGVVVGFHGAVRALCESIAREAFGERAPSGDSASPSAGAPRGERPILGVLTGGASALARGAVTEALGAPPLEEPLLVHLGLAAAVRR